VQSVAEIIQFEPGAVGDGFRVSPDDVLEAAKGGFVSVVVVGQSADGEIVVAGSDGAPERLMLLQWASLHMVSNRVSR